METPSGGMYAEYPCSTCQWNRTMIKQVWGQALDLSFSACDQAKTGSPGDCYAKAPTDWNADRLLHPAKCISIGRAQPTRCRYGSFCMLGFGAPTILQLAKAFSGLLQCSSPQHSLPCSEGSAGVKQKSLTPAPLRPLPLTL